MRTINGNDIDIYVRSEDRAALQKPHLESHMISAHVMQLLTRQNLRLNA